jgi:hypothetical protein
MGMVLRQAYDSRWRQRCAGADFNIASNGATWAFGGGVPMGNTGLATSRPNNGPVTSFAQTIGGSSQSAAPLDLS